MVIKDWLSSQLRRFVVKHSYEWIVSDWKRINDLDLCAKVLTTDRFRTNLATQLIEPPSKGNRLLVIAPHQDDETIGAGGTLIKAAENGAIVTCIYLTDGSQGSIKVPDEEMKQIRQREARAVWEKIGGHPIFLEFLDGGTPLNDEASEILANHVDDIRPDIIFLPFLLDDHPEHRRANHLFWLTKEKLVYSNFDIWAYQVWSGLIPNVAVDISDVIDKKNEINKMWESQNVLRDFVHFSQALSAYNSKFIHTNQPLFLEIFFVVPVAEYFDLCQVYFNNALHILYADYESWKKRTNDL